MCRPLQNDVAAFGLAPVRGHGDRFFAGQKPAGKRCRAFEHLGGCSLKNNFTALLACARSQVDNLVTRRHHVRVMLHYQHCVAQVAQLFEGFNEPQIVPLVQADGRLVEHVQDPRQAGADLCGQADALAFAAGESRGRAREIQIIHADIEHKSQPAFNFLDDPLCDEHLLLGELQVFDEGKAFADGHEAQLINIFASHRDGQAFFFQPRPAAGFAGS